MWIHFWKVKFKYFTKAPIKLCGGDHRCSVKNGSKSEETSGLSLIRWINMGLLFSVKYTMFIFPSCYGHIFAKKFLVKINAFFYYNDHTILKNKRKINKFLLSYFLGKYFVSYQLKINNVCIFCLYTSYTHTVTQTAHTVKQWASLGTLYPAWDESGL